MFIAIVGATPAAADKAKASADLSKVADAATGSLQWKFKGTFSKTPGTKSGPIAGATRGELMSFKSVRPLSADSDGKTFLRFSLRRFEFGSAKAAAAAVKGFLDTADNNTGHTYAWDMVTTSGSTVYWLHCPCLLSRKNFAKAANSVRKHAKATSSVTCTCGGGCSAAPR